MYLQALYPDLPDVSLDDVYLCMGNKYLNSGKNYVISVNEQTGITDLNEAGVGQSVAGLHYENRNKVCKYLLEQFVL